MTKQSFDILETPLAQVVFVALLWIILYKLNGFLFEFSEVIPSVNLIFLPAVLRVVVVLMFGFWAAVGLSLGSCLTMDADDILRGPLILTLDVIVNGVGPLVGVLIGKRLMKVPDSLSGLRWSHIITFSCLCGLSNALFHQPLHLLMPVYPGFYNTTVVMFVGDMIGCTIMLYGWSMMIKVYRYARA